MTTIPDSITERMAVGKALREIAPRSSHGEWTIAEDRPDPVQLLDASSAGRIEHLIPIRNERMSASAFAFFRGAAAVMAADLGPTPRSGLMVQACGDAHCMNFGAFATPERRLIFDVNDFDETLPGPWEWDVKRLAASLVLAARHNKLKAGDARIAVLAASEEYRRRMAGFAKMTVLEVWYSRIDTDEVIYTSADDDRRRRERMASEARENSGAAAVEKFTEVVEGRRRIREEPPLLYHPADADQGEFDLERILASYTQSLRSDVRVLFGRYRLVDHAIKVVGVGSVGTRCAIALFETAGNDALLLQIKEANPSVLEGHLEASVFKNHGERVVRGQRIMQFASDIFLGWGSSGEHDFYIRQLKDMKASVEIDAMDAAALTEYGRYCAWALASAHARSGRPAAIAGYLGKSDVFDKAMVKFADSYADQAERDYAAFTGALRKMEDPIAGAPG
ncbi:MAG: DUF2252 domain-containing protein [Candidatus Velthaea sp.]